MKISYNWLKEYIELPESPEEVGQMLTATGLEVEYIKPFEVIKGGLAGLVIGETITCIKHPNADHLSVTTVDVGDNAPCQIICGAPNVAAGQKVVVAKQNTILHPLHGNPFVIKKTKIRGEYSYGMICAEAEIGLEETHSGIIVLNDNTIPNGTPAAAFYKVENDSIFEIGLTPNRGDATSHIGLARDLKALKGRSIKWPSVDGFTTDRADDTISVTIEKPAACPRYAAVTIADIEVKDSPKWLQTRLNSIGLSPINNVVDITNYVCHELGQPLHAFDADQIAGNRVIVQTLPEGSVFKTLDDKERTLTTKDLMICDAKGGMCIAGVFGGLSHGVTQKTNRIFLESAYFCPISIRQTGVHHQLKTDASFRFERGVDPHRVVYALKRAAMLIKEIAGGIISSNIIDLYPQEVPYKEITVKRANVDRLIGHPIAHKEIVKILEALDMSVQEKEDNTYTVSVPPYRVGIEREADIVEEILRIYGFDKIGLHDNAGTNYLSHFPEKDVNRYRRAFGEMLTANGYYEIITNSITHKSYYKKYGLAPIGQPIDMLNAAHEDQATLRQHMLFTGLEVCAHNINRKQKNLKLFEWGKVYAKHKNDYKEDERLALYLSGDVEKENWRHQSRPVTYFDLLQQIVSILERGNLIGCVTQTEIKEDPLFEYGVNWTKGGIIIGKSGKVKATLTTDFGITQDVFYTDFAADLLFNAAGAKPTAKAIPKYPAVRRDLSLLLDKETTFGEVKQLVFNTEKKYIKEVIVFDAYEGKNIPEGKKAYGLGFILLDMSRTLKDKEIDKTMNKLIKVFEQKMNAVIRRS